MQNNNQEGKEKEVILRWVKAKDRPDNYDSLHWRDAETKKGVFVVAVDHFAVITAIEEGGDHDSYAVDWNKLQYLEETPVEPIQEASVSFVCTVPDCPHCAYEENDFGEDVQEANTADMFEQIMLKHVLLVNPEIKHEDIKNQPLWKAHINAMLECASRLRSQPVSTNTVESSSEEKYTQSDLDAARREGVRNQIDAKTVLEFIDKFRYDEVGNCYDMYDSETFLDFEMQMKHIASLPASEPMVPVSQVMDAMMKIACMKREEGETDDRYAFNRCYHIASDFISTLPQSPKQEEKKISPFNPLDHEQTK